jgi:hypothetical protein
MAKKSKILTLFALLSFSLSAAERGKPGSASEMQEQTIMLGELQRDGISVRQVLDGGTNPLRNGIRPTVLEKKRKGNGVRAMAYEFHAWGERDSRGVYPIYKWELVRVVGRLHDYDLVRSWDGSTQDPKLYNGLNEDEGQILEETFRQRHITGGLTKSNLSHLPFKKRFLMVGKAGSASAPVERKEQAQPSPPTQLEPLAPTPPAPQPQDSKEEKEPYGIPVPGKKGYIYPPPEKGKQVNPDQMIDARDLPPGTRIHDPYSAQPRILRVP